MSDLIDRQALCEFCLNTKDRAIDANDIIRFPSAEPERKKGKWQRRKDEDCWECSECHAYLDNDDICNHNFYYCYHCGAEMTRGE